MSAKGKKIVGNSPTQQRHESPCTSSKFQRMGCPMMGGESDGGGGTLGGGDNGEFRYPLVDGDDRELVILVASQWMKMMYLLWMVF
nr:hypothetical protein [Tanacetum cinerariifolium]